jgi:hypothetical protein
MTKCELWESYVVVFQEARVKKYNNQYLSLFISAHEIDKRNLCQHWSHATVKSHNICAAYDIKDSVSKIAEWKQEHLWEYREFDKPV